LRHEQRRRPRAQGRRLPSRACSRTASRLAISPVCAKNGAARSRAEQPSWLPKARSRVAPIAAHQASDLARQRSACGEAFPRSGRILRGEANGPRASPFAVGRRPG
jgi:hypothetical protein